MTSRRDFIATASLAATGLALAPLAACSQNPADPPVREKPAGAIAGNDHFEILIGPFQLGLQAGVVFHCQEFGSCVAHHATFCASRA